MTSLRIAKNALRVSISKSERINFKNAMKIIRKGKRIIDQNNATSAIIEIDNSCEVNQKALNILDRIIDRQNNFSIVVIQS